MSRKLEGLYVYGHLTCKIDRLNMGVAQLLARKSCISEARKENVQEESKNEEDG